MERILGTIEAVIDDRVDAEAIEVVDHGDRLVIRARSELRDVASKKFSRPTVGAAFSPAAFTAPDVSLVGFAYTQFALPVRAAPGDGFDFAPAHNLRSPSAVLPLLLCAPDGRFDLLAPLDAWHEQLIAVEQTTDPRGIDRFVWGWHGDLDVVPPGFTATLGIFTGSSARDVIEEWGHTVRSAAGTKRPPADADPLLTHLSYWTDNGAAYWYRTEPGKDITSTLSEKVAELEALGTPVRSVELDSWFYPHEVSRSVSESGYLEEVPPTGMLSWTPRPEVLPEGIEGLRRALGDRPLALHSRHISPHSPYVGEGAEWWLDTAAHPVDPAFFDRWVADAKAWGATCIEQDWMMMVFFGTRDLRSAPGRTMAWQRALDRSASAHDMNLLWCMALPGDFAATVELDRVIAVRTSDDYRFADDPADLWIWYLTVNAIAAALRLPVFKDCFFSNPDPGDGDTDGDPHAELEALLSAMSAGVVGLGDRLGRTDVEIVSRVCRSDGHLVGPDRPITIADQSMVDAGRNAGLCWSSTETVNELGTWRYVLAINTSADHTTRTDRFDVGENTLVYRWRSGEAALSPRIEVELEAREWELFVCCPLDDAGSAVIGDPSVYATMSGVPASPAREPLRWSQEDGLHTKIVSLGS